MGAKPVLYGLPLVLREVRSFCVSHVLAPFRLLVRGFAHNAKRNAGRYLPPAMRNEAKRIVSEQKRKLSAAASAEGQVAGLAEKLRAELDAQNAMFSSATAVVIDEERIRFLIPKRNDGENEIEQ